MLMICTNICCDNIILTTNAPHFFTFLGNQARWQQDNIPVYFIVFCYFQNLYMMVYY